MGGDFNAAPAPAIDRKSGALGARLTASPQDAMLARFIHDAQLLDIWRLHHPGDHDFSFYSHPHSSYSRIDLFLLPTRTIPLTTRSAIGSISWSDHAPVSVWVKLPGTRSGWSWRLNSSILQSAAVLEEVSAHLNRYFEENDLDDIGPDSLWLAHKAVIRGHLIQIGSRLKRERMSLLVELQERLADREAAHKSSHSQADFDALTTVRRELRSALLTDVARSLAWTRRTFYEYSNKAHTMLARKLRNQTRSKLVTSAHTSQGSITTIPSEVNQIFTAYFKKLYNHSPDHSLRNPEHVREVQEFLATWKGPELPPLLLEGWGQKSQKPRWLQ
uniref:Endonuclease/exonuclease/phosphatase domain-containing protein n=1 Tax=Leptobrachium leishanense TaxID=445787 RepID=A0A8C5P9R1_9ANUR